MKTNTAVLTSIVTAVGASLCCIVPFLAILAGTSTFASSFDWLEPARPILIGISIVVLVWAWYRQIKSSSSPDCDCARPASFWQGRTFLTIVTVFSISLMGFPYYSSTLLSPAQQQEQPATLSNSQYRFSVSGMTCSGCELHVEQAVSELAGVSKVDASYSEGATVVEFDSTRVSVEKLKKAINATGYKVE